MAIARSLMTKQIKNLSIWVDHRNLPKFFGEMLRMNPKSMWIRWPSECSKMFPLCLESERKSVSTNWSFNSTFTCPWLEADMRWDNKQRMIAWNSFVLTWNCPSLHRHTRRWNILEDFCSNFSWSDGAIPCWRSAQWARCRCSSTRSDKDEPTGQYSLPSKFA